MNMKYKILLIGAIIFSSTIATAQNWKLNGNNISGSDFLGTSNNEDLVFKVNNQEGFRLKASNYNLVFKSKSVFKDDAVFHYDVKFKTLEDSNSTIIRPVGVNNNGKLELLSNSFTTYDSLYVFNKIKIGTNSLYLGGVGTNYIYTDGGPLRINANEGQPTLENTTINQDGGNVGIGTNTPLRTLDVNGDLKVGSNNNYLVMGDDGNNTYLDAYMAGPITNKNLLINYYSGKGVQFGNPNFSVGPKVEVRVSGALTAGPGVVSSQSQFNVVADIGKTYGAYITQGNQTAGGYGLFTKVSRDDHKAIAVCKLDNNGPLEVFNVMGDGRISLGTSVEDPVYGFHPSNTLYKILVKQSMVITGDNGVMGFRSSNTPNYHGDNAMCLEVRPNGHPQFPSSTDPFRGLNFFRPFANGQDRANGNFDLFISSQPGMEGNVGIGTPYPKSKLTISSAANELVFAVTQASSGDDVFRVMGNGNVFATRVRVLTTPFPDYVFNKDYKLIPLNELETYIEDNKHLPNMPAAKEVETNGADLGEINRVLVEKVEELTLYMIALDKRMKTLEEENEVLKK